MIKYIIKTFGDMFSFKNYIATLFFAMLFPIPLLLVGGLLAGSHTFEVASFGQQLAFYSFLTLATSFILYILTAIADKVFKRLKK